MQNNTIFRQISPERLSLKEPVEHLLLKDKGRSMRKVCFIKGAKFSAIIIFQLFVRKKKDLNYGELELMQLVLTRLFSQTILSVSCWFIDGIIIYSR